MKVNRAFPDAETLRELYYGQKLTQKEIAKETAWSYSTIRRLFKRYKIPTRNSSDYIRLAYQRGRRRNYLPKSERGPKSWNWKGVRKLNGYILRYKPEHHRAMNGHHKGYVLEHILIWERANKKRLPDGWVVHHLNGIRSDNRPENLVALPRKTHDRLIPLYQKRIRKLEQKVKHLEGLIHEKENV